MANSADLDQTALKQFGQSLHCVLKRACPNIPAIYGRSILSQINKMYELIMAQKKAREQALMMDLPGMKVNPKYEYDSDEETEGGTWEHKQRKVEMEATRG